MTSLPTSDSHLLEKVLQNFDAEVKYARIAASIFSKLTAASLIYCGAFYLVPAFELEPNWLDVVVKGTTLLLPALLCMYAIEAATKRHLRERRKTKIEWLKERCAIDAAFFDDLTKNNVER